MKAYKETFETRKAPKKGSQQMGLSEASVRAALGELIRGFGHDPALINVKNLQEIADKLSQVARKEPPWGWRYLRNLLNGKIEPSRALTEAILALGATLDGVPALRAQGKPVQVLAIGEVRPGAVVLADSRPCQRPGCVVHFVPRVPGQKFCSGECRKRARREIRD